MPITFIYCRDTEVITLRAQLTDARGRADSEKARVVSLESFYSDQLKTLRDSIESARRAREEESKKWRLDYEAARESYEARLAARQNEIEAQKQEITEAADAAVTAIQREAKRREEDFTGAMREATERLQQAQKASEEARNQSSALSAALEATRQALRAAEADAAEAHAMADANRAEFESAINALNREKDAATTSKQALLDEYEARMNDLLNSLRQVRYPCRRDANASGGVMFHVD
jgi:chromosome segregation ATPase